MKIRNIFGNRYSGAMGKDFVASSWKGHDYLKEYTAPSNPKSDLQTEHRAIFAQASAVWKTLPARSQEFYNKIADGMSGMNLFVGRYIQSTRNGQAPETPIVMSWKTADGRPVVDGWLIVRQGAKPLFTDSLKDAVGTIALTPSDAPYTFVLRKGAQEDVVLTVQDLLETDVPTVLESPTLGIKLVADMENPQPEPGWQPIKQSTIFTARDEILQLYLADNLQEYLIQIVLATRKPAAYGDDLAGWLQYGASPRATIGLDRCARALAWLDGRDFVTPEDIQAIAFDILRHRLILNYEAEAEGINTDRVIAELIQRIAVP